MLNKSCVRINTLAVHTGGFRATFPGLIFPTLSNLSCGSPPPTGIVINDLSTCVVIILMLWN